MRKLLLVLIANLLFCLAIFCQNKSTFFIGVNPAVSVESEYFKGDFDINVLPLVLEFPIAKQFDIRAISVLNYGFRNTYSALINYGAELSIPYYVSRKQKKYDISKGFFIALGGAFNRNYHYYHSNLSLFFEPGYNFLFGNNFALTIDLQFGRTYYWYDAGANIVGSHFGVKVILGRWF